MTDGTRRLLKKKKASPGPRALAGGVRGVSLCESAASPRHGRRGAKAMRIPVPVPRGPRPTPPRRRVGRSRTAGVSETKRRASKSGWRVTCMRALALQHLFTPCKTKTAQSPSHDRLRPTALDSPREARSRPVPGTGCQPKAQQPVAGAANAEARPPKCSEMSVRQRTRTAPRPEPGATGSQTTSRQ